MAGHGEVVLRQRVCFGCQTVFWICQHCDRGHRYCSLACRTQARLQQRRRANCRHQRSPEGRLDHRDRQRQYRCRQRASVTDPGSFRSLVRHHRDMRSQRTPQYPIRPQAKPSAGSDGIAAGGRTASSAAVAAVGWTLSRAFHDASDEQLP